MNTLCSATRLLIVFAIAACMAVTAAAQEAVVGFTSMSQPFSGLVSGGDGYLYGTTNRGGTAGRGSIYRLHPASGDVTTRFSFTGGSSGEHPMGDLVRSGTFLYGTTTDGTIFRHDISTGSTTIEAHLDANSVGMWAYGGLTALGGYLYGTTSSGASDGRGSVFRFDPNTSVLSGVASFNDLTGYVSYGQLTAVGGVLYGVRESGGSYGSGTLFKVDPSTGTLTVLKEFDGGADGGYPQSGLLLSGGMLYGVASSGGTSGKGTLFKVDPNSGVLTTLASFTGGTGPCATLITDGTFLYGTTARGGTFDHGTVFKSDFSGTITTLASLNQTNGAIPTGALVLDGANLYGTAWTGGAYGSGSIFKVPLAVSVPMSAVYSFPATNGSDPNAVELILSGSYLYGTTANGGAHGMGSVFKVHVTTGALTTVVSFDGSNGATPLAGLVSDGTYLYGTTTSGGANNYGTVFRVKAADDSFSTVGSFVFSNTGSHTSATMVVIGSYLYGANPYGGPDGRGTIFKVDLLSSTISRVFSFNSSTGFRPYAVNTFGAGYLYGVTSNGGANDDGTIFRVNLATAAVETLHSFTDAEGRFPYGALAVIGSLMYGTTSDYGPGGKGTIFQFNAATNGVTTLFAFNGTNGAAPSARLTVSGQTLYGTTRYGGPADNGTIFSYDVAGGTTNTLASFDDATTGSELLGGLLLNGPVAYGLTAGGGPGGAGVLYRLALQPATSTITLASSQNPSTFGSAVTFTATVSNGTGVVWFLDGSTKLGSAVISAGQASFTTRALASGPHSITAAYMGDGMYKGATSTALVQTVNSIVPSFSDNWILPQVTVIKAIHLIELQTAVNAVRSAAGLTPVVWAKPAPQGLPVTTSDVISLRDALGPALVIIGRQPSFKNLIRPGGVIKALDFQELRNLTY